MIVCTKCGVEKEEVEFRYHSGKCRECSNERNREYYSETRDIRRKHTNDKHKRDRIEFINAFGGRCVRCGETDWRALAVDHIHGGGNKDPHQRQSKKWYAYVLSHPELFQCLCANCNWIKRYEEEECL